MARRSHRSTHTNESKRNEDPAKIPMIPVPRLRLHNSKTPPPQALPPAYQDSGAPDMRRLEQTQMHPGQPEPCFLECRCGVADRVSSSTVSDRRPCGDRALEVRTVTSLCRPQGKHRSAGREILAIRRARRTTSGEEALRTVVQSHPSSGQRCIILPSSPMATAPIAAEMRFSCASSTRLRKRQP